MIRFIDKGKIALLLCISIFFVFVFPNNILAQEVPNSVEVKVLVDNQDDIILEGSKDGASATLTYDKETTAILFTANDNLFQKDGEFSKFNTTNEERTFEVAIKQITPQNEISVTFDDISSNDIYTIDTIDQGLITPNFAFLLPLGLIIGQILLEQLIAMALAVTIAGTTYAVVTSVRDILRNKPDKHYMAKLMQGNLYIGSSLSLGQASARLVGFNPYDQDVWSVSAGDAETVARVAGGGVNTPEGPELSVKQPQGYFFYTHFHTWNRVGGHSFF